MQEIKNLAYIWLVGIKLPSVTGFQPSSHWYVVSWLCAYPPWCSDDLEDDRWHSRRWEMRAKNDAARLSWSQIGCCKFVPGSWSRFYQPHKLWGPWLCLATGDYQQGCHPILCKFGQHYSNNTKWGKTYKLRSNQHKEKTFTWYPCGSGFYDTYLVHLVFRRLATRSVSGFVNWSKRDLASLSFKDRTLLSEKRRDLRSAVVFLTPGTWDAVIQITCPLASDKCISLVC